MSCLTSEKIGLYVDGLLPADERSDIAAHLLSCNQCSAKADQYREENEVLKNVWSNSGTDSYFTGRVMASLADVKMDEPASVPPQVPIRKKRFALRGKRIAGIAAAAVASVLVVGSYASPTFAAYLSSLFTSSQWHAGIKQAAKEGFVQPAGKVSVSNGVTFRVMDIFSDKSRIMAYYEVIDQNGNYIDPQMETKGSQINKAVLTDKQGIVLVESNGWRREGERAVLEFPVPEGTYDQLILHLDIKELNATAFSPTGGSTITSTVRGEWRIETPIDMKKSNDASKSIAVNKKFISPQGVQVSLDELQIHPSSFVAKIGAEWTDGAGKRILPTQKEKIERNSRIQLEYHFQSEDGRVLGAYPELTNMVSVNGQNGAGFLPINGLDRIKFVLDAVQTEEPADVKLDLDMKKWNGQPMTFTADGSTFVIESIGQEIHKGLPFQVVHLSGVLSEDTKYYFWTAVDDQGKEYQVGGTFDDKLQDGKKHFEQTTMWSEMDPMPTKFTLKATTVVKRYSGMKWEETIQIK